MELFSAENFIKKLDGFLNAGDLSSAGKYLEAVYAEEKGNPAATLTILNEMIGLYRQTMEKDKGFAAIKEALSVTDSLNPSPVTAGTVYLNAATTIKAFGNSREAIPYYEKAENLLYSSLKSDHPLIAGLCNNMALALQDINEAEKAEQYFRKALSITEKDRDLGLETAVTCINLAHLLFDNDPVDKEIDSLLDRAFEILNDPYYSGFGKYAFTCEKCAPSFGFFGRIFDEKSLKERAQNGYERNTAEQALL